MPEKYAMRPWGGLPCFQLGNAGDRGEEVLNNMEGEEGGKKEWILFGGRMEEGKMDETWMARWMGLWSPGEPLIGEPSMEEREPCPSSLSCNIFPPYLYIHLLRLSSTINKVGGRQEVFVTFRVSIDPGADFTFENKLSYCLLFSIKHR